ncbi:platelet glycoprotein V-like [Mytilus edulis]|uniref:platelet glycoprotein V-like n=1 Tax=Mytilus edulis TaxID=6550 RepID=UPI0039EF6D42
MDQKYSDTKQVLQTLIAPSVISHRTRQWTRNTQTPNRFYRNLRGNKLESLPEGLLTFNTNLEYLNLRGNKLESLPEGLLTFNTNLEYLDISYNNLVSLPEGLLSDKTNLEEVNLRGNKLESLPEGLLTFNTNLEYLNLRRNKLESLPEGLLTFNTNLEYLDIGYNNLVSLPEGLLSDNTNLEEVYVDVNPLICCLIIEFKELVSSNTQLDYAGTCTILNTTKTIRDFNKSDCIFPVDGGWSPWFNSSCSVSCGEGVRIQNRTCDNPPPSGSGQKCVGSEIEISICNLGKCPESCRHSKNGSDNKQEYDLDNRAGKKQRKMKNKKQKRRNNFKLVK